MTQLHIIMITARDVTTKQKKNQIWRCARFCHTVVLRNFDTVVQTILLIFLLKQMEIRDLIRVSSASPHERRVEWFPVVCTSLPSWDDWNDLLPSWRSWSQWTLGRHSRREDHTFSFAWLLENRLDLKGVRDAATGERNVRMHKFQPIKWVSFSTYRYVSQLRTTATTTESY